ncbi:MAG: MarR family transcriptional regulator [Armatimonadetes bacterium]|nr:MarR family transcriptional regulator [Armatimonadota bacterium]
MPPSRRREETSLKLSRVAAEDSLEQQLFFGLRRIAQGVEVDSRRLAKQHNVTGPQLIALCAVVHLGPTTATDVSQRVYLSPSTVVGIFDRLEAKGLMKRERDRQDRRIVFVTPTDAGRELVAQAPHPLFASLRELLKGLNKADQKAVGVAVDRLAQIIGEPTVE